MPNRVLSKHCLFLLAAMLLFSTSCSLFFSRPRTSLRGLDTVNEQVAAALTRSLREQAARTTSMRALLHVTLGRAGVKQDFSQVVVFYRPSELRVELFATQLHRLVSMVIANQGQLSAYIPEQNQAYRGSATPDNVARLLRIPFSPEELMLWLAGEFKVPYVGEIDSLTALRSKRRDRVVIDVALRDGRRILASFRSEPDAPNRFELQSLEILIAESNKSLFFSEFTYASTQRAPTQIDFELRAESLKGTIAFRQQELNPPLDKSLREKLFRIRIPRSAIVLPLESAGEPLF